MRELRIRFPALAFGLVLVLLCCVFTPYNNIRLQNSPVAGGHFPLASFVCLFIILVVVNPALGAINRKWRFHYHELLLIWAMVTVATGIAYTGLMRTFIINITSPTWLKLSSGETGQLLQSFLPSALFPNDPEMVRTLYSGFSGGIDMTWWQVLSRIPWSAWLTPMFWWAIFIGLVYMAMLGMVGLFSHQWIENEKMNFPLLRVPEVLSQEAEDKTLRRFLTHRYFIVGLTIPVLLHLLNGLHTYFPQVPQIPTLVLAQPYIPKEGLLSGFYKMKIYIYPAFIGFAFLASKQVSFSLWSFFILGGLLPGILKLVGWRFPAAALGTTFGPVLSKVEEMQMIGAFGMYFFFLLWLSRQHLLAVLKSAFSRSRETPEYCGLMSPRPALYLFFIGIVGITAWLTFFGMSLLSAILFLAVCFMLQLVASRLICQGGLPYFTLTLAPSDGFLAFLDTRLIGPATLGMAVILQKVTFLDMRESLMPSICHASKLSDGSRPRNRFLWGIVWAIALGMVVSFAAMLALYYRYGVNALPDDWAIESTRRVHENVTHLFSHPEEPKSWSIAFTLIGAAFMGLLVMGYHRFIWWPLHPIGYLVTYSSAMQILWFGFFIGWLCNTLVLRYGGANLYREIRRLFIGLIVGDMIMAVIWLIVGLFTPISYHVLPL
ncbi:DUF6785 family protein [Syntrophobacter fumaroxidans]|uniref:Uncharacterized protein n=1 Tax=Syntrophobacter fumaroxidans (strain DSM 10017 / MPOB) TaxID=335543 RepID=A0LEU9_SYNFM|nr:DUF6785 family protein [Syntrophobacter fumaroxidans]ABK15951.1 conserved hypothetical protein [Syntrophobacter fumaroxidans MPOB]